MANEIKIFENPEFGNVRIQMNASGEPLFCLTDVCKALDLDSSQVIKRLDDGVVSIHPIIDKLGREQKANFVNEEGLYDVILDSRKPSARLFRKWITSEVLPSIRKTGGYSKELSRKELALMIIQQEEEKERLMLENKKNQEIIEASRPAVAFTAAVQAAQSSCLVGELAKIISQNGVEIGEKRLFKWLREHKYLGSHGERYNIPNQEYIERGYFELKKGVRSGSNGVMHTTVTPKVTGKGQVYFVNKFLSSNGKEGGQYAI